MSAGVSTAGPPAARRLARHAEPGRWVEWFAVAVLVHSTGAFLAVLSAQGPPRPIVLLLWMLAYAVATLALLDGVLRARMIIAFPLSVTIFTAIVTLSVLWSQAPGISLRRAFGLAGTVTVAVFLAHRLRPLDLLEATRRAVVIIAVASLVLLLLDGGRATDDLHASLRGVLTTKNSLGRVLAVGILSTTLLALLDAGRRRRCAVSVAPMLVALSLTDSAGGIVITVLGVLILGVLALRTSVRGKGLLASGTALALSCLVFLVPFDVSASDVAGLAGRDPTLTGRTEIWQESAAAVGQRPLLGYGYGAFWDSEPGPAQGIRQKLQYEVANAHNGLLENALGLGLIGVIAALAVLGSVIVGGMRDLRVAVQRRRGLLRLYVTTLVVATTVVESGLLQENTLLTILLVCVLAMHPESPLARRNRAPAALVPS